MCKTNMGESRYNCFSGNCYWGESRYKRSCVHLYFFATQAAPIVSSYFMSGLCSFILFHNWSKITILPVFDFFINFYFFFFFHLKLIFYSLEITPLHPNPKVVTFLTRLYQELPPFFFSLKKSPHLVPSATTTFIFTLHQHLHLSIVHLIEPMKLPSSVTSQNPMLKFSFLT